MSNADEIARLDALHAAQFDGAAKQNGDAVEDGEVDGVQVVGAKWARAPQGSPQCEMSGLLCQTTACESSSLSERARRAVRPTHDMRTGVAEGYLLPSHLTTAAPIIVGVAASLITTVMGKSSLLLSLQIIPVRGRGRELSPHHNI